MNIKTLIIIKIILNFIGYSFIYLIISLIIIIVKKKR